MFSNYRFTATETSKIEKYWHPDRVGFRKESPNYIVECNPCSRVGVHGTRRMLGIYVPYKNGKEWIDITNFGSPIKKHKSTTQVFE